MTRTFTPKIFVPVFLTKDKSTEYRIDVEQSTMSAAHNGKFHFSGKSLDPKTGELVIAAKCRRF